MLTSIPFPQLAEVCRWPVNFSPRVYACQTPRSKMLLGPQGELDHPFEELVGG